MTDSLTKESFDWNKENDKVLSASVVINHSVQSDEVNKTSKDGLHKKLAKLMFSKSFRK